MYDSFDYVIYIFILFDKTKCTCICVSVYFYNLHNLIKFYKKKKNIEICLQLFSFYIAGLTMRQNGVFYV